MGEDPVEYEPGANCGFCWGIGKTWGNFPTPKRIYIIIDGFVGAQAECNGTWTATQDVGVPCWFWFEEGNVFGSVEFQVTNTQFKIRWMGGEVFVKAEGLCKKHSEIGAKTMDIV